MDRQLRKNIVQMFVQKPHSTLDSRHLSKLFAKQNYEVQDLFNARYDPLFLQNISKKQVFGKVILTLQNMIKTKKQLKGAAKNRKAVIFQDQDYLLYFIALLFTSKQKQMLYKHLTQVFGIEQQKQCFFESEQSRGQQYEEKACEILMFSLSKIFGIGETFNEFSKVEKQFEE